MIRNLIFDLGAVLLDIDLEAFKKELARIRDSNQFSFNHQELGFYRDYERGVIGTDAFFSKLGEQFSGSVKEQELRMAWELILKEPIPESMEFLRSVQGKYKTYLLSNTNEAHRKQFDEMFNKSLGEGQFYKLFDEIYYSYEMGAIKPNAEIYQQLLRKSGLRAEECLFIDDNEENIIGAQAVGINAWLFKGPGDWPAVEAALKKAT